MFQIATGTNIRWLVEIWTVHGFIRRTETAAVNMVGTSLAASAVTIVSAMIRA